MLHKGILLILLLFSGTLQVTRYMVARPGNEAIGRSRRLDYTDLRMLPGWQLDQFVTVSLITHTYCEYRLLNGLPCNKLAMMSACTKTTLPKCTITS